MKTPLQIAQEFVGKREVTKNQSPEIKTLWPDTSYPEGYKNREPYCAAFVCHCLAEARRQGIIFQSKSLPQEASVRYFLDWCQGRKGILVFQPNTQAKIKSIVPGDIFILLPKVSHMGFVKSSDGTRIETTEGNTDGSSGREGDGFYNKSRAISSVGWIVRFL